MQTSGRTDEGVRMFRALILTFLLYVAFSLVLGGAWFAWRHWHLR